MTARMERGDMLIWLIQVTDSMGAAMVKLAGAEEEWPEEVLLEEVSLEEEEVVAMVAEEVAMVLVG